MKNAMSFLRNMGLSKLRAKARGSLCFPYPCPEGQGLLKSAPVQDRPHNLLGELITNPVPLGRGHKRANNLTGL